MNSRRTVHGNSVIFVSDPPIIRSNASGPQYGAVGSSFCSFFNHGGVGSSVVVVVGLGVVVVVVGLGVVVVGLGVVVVVVVGLGVVVVVVVGLVVVGTGVVALAIGLNFLSEVRLQQT